MNVLVLYHAAPVRTRATIVDHLYCFKRYSGHTCFYVNAAVRGLPWWLSKVSFDAVIFSTTFLSSRWSPERFESLMETFAQLKDLSAYKIAIPQDEFLYSDLLVEFIDTFCVDAVYSCFGETEWDVLYQGLDFDRVRFGTVLTGYIEPMRYQGIERYFKNDGDRSTFAGYRAWHAAAWLGRHGQIKHEVATAAREACERLRMSHDISTDSEDTLYGDDWYRFLSDCQVAVGCEGGASIADRDGSVMLKTNEYVDRHPSASFEKIEAACFPGRDGELDGWALSPRHLECCATRTCQVLVEGDYTGVLKAGIHYIPVKRDLSDLDEALRTASDQDVREKIVSAAYEDIVQSGEYSYQAFVDRVIQEIEQEQGLSGTESDGRSWRTKLLWVLTLMTDRYDWCYLWAWRQYRLFRSRMRASVHR